MKGNYKEFLMNTLQFQNKKRKFLTLNIHKKEFL